MRTALYCILFCLASCAAGYLLGRESVKQNTEYKIETDTINIVDTVKLKSPYPVYKKHIETKTDTLYSVDSVLVHVKVPIEQKTYKDSLYTAYVSGYKANLDSINIVKKNTIVKNTVVIKEKQKFSLSLQSGYGITNNKLSPYIGLGFSFCIVGF